MCSGASGRYSSCAAAATVTRLRRLSLHAYRRHVACGFIVSLMLTNLVIDSVQGKSSCNEIPLETEFGVFPVSDAVDVRNSQFLVKYDLSDNLLCQLCKNLLRNCVIYTVSEFTV